MCKKVAFNVCLMILFVMLLTSCQTKGYKNEVSEERGDSFVSQKSMSNHSELFWLHRFQKSNGTTKRNLKTKNLLRKKIFLNGITLMR